MDQTQFQRKMYVFSNDDWTFSSAEMQSKKFMYSLHLDDIKIKFTADNVIDLSSIINVMNNESSKEKMDTLRSLAMIINAAIAELRQENSKIFNADGTISDYTKRPDSFVKLKLKTWTIILFLRTYIDVSMMLYSHNAFDSISDIFSKTTNQKKKKQIDSVRDKLNLSAGALHFLKVIIDGSNNIKHLKDDEVHKVNLLSNAALPSILLTLHAYNDEFEPSKDNENKTITYNCEQPVADLVHGANLFILKIFDTYDETDFLAEGQPISG